MNRKRIALALVVIMLLCIGCGKKKDEEAESLPIPEVSETQVQSESLPGTAVNEFSPDGFEEVGKETDPTSAPAVAPEDRDDVEPEPTEPKPTEPKPTEPKPTEPKPTEPKPTEPKPTEPKPTEPEATEPAEEEPRVTYEDYINMSPEEQVAFIQKFDSMQDFLTWHKQAKAEYEKDHGAIDIEDGNIDLGGIT